MKTEYLVESVKKILKAMAYTNPMVYAVVSQFDIVFVDEKDVSTAATDGYRLFINREYWGSLDDRKRYLVLFHEALHALFDHPARVRNIVAGNRRVRRCALLAAEGIVDYYMISTLGVGNKEVSPRAVGVEDVCILVEGRSADECSEDSLERIRGRSLEELVEIALKVRAPCLAWSTSGLTMCRRYPTVGEGDWLESRGFKAYSGALSSSGLGEEIKRALRAGEAWRASSIKASNAAALASSLPAPLSGEKLAGTGAGDLWRAVDDVASGVADWSSVLLKLFSGPTVVGRRSWSRPNRKLPGLKPGRLYEPVIDTVAALIDVSGSVGDEEYMLLAGAVLDAAAALRPRRVVVIWWDHGVRRVAEAHSPASLRELVVSGSPGGGGTVVTPALKTVRERLRLSSSIVILASDYYFYEDVGEVVSALDSLKAKGATIALVATPSHNSQMLEELSRIADLTVVLPERSPYRRAGV